MKKEKKEISEKWISVENSKTKETKGMCSWGDYAIRKILTFNIRYSKKLVERREEKNEKQNQNVSDCDNCFEN